MLRKLIVCILTSIGYGLSAYAQNAPMTLQDVTDLGNTTSNSISIWNRNGLNIGVDSTTNYTTTTHYLRPSPVDPRTVRFDCTSSTTTGGWEFFNAATNKSIMFIKQNSGFVGIGTTDPKARLSVNGDIYAKKVRVTPDEWADYVFEPAYVLPSLHEVEQYIKEHKHLPEIPSAKEVSEQGLDVGLNQSKLLKKIEEMTLYLIEQQKKMTAQKKIIEEQARLLAEQGTRLQELETKTENK